MKTSPYDRALRIAIDLLESEIEAKQKAVEKLQRIIKGRRSR